MSIRNAIMIAAIACVIFGTSSQFSAGQGISVKAQDGFRGDGAFGVGIH